MMGANAGEQNTYTNPALGFTITKPANWKIASAGDYFKNLGQVNLDDSGFQEKVKEYARAPFFVFMKYPKPYDNINSSIKVYFRYCKSLPNHVENGPKDILNTALLVFKETLKNLKVIKGPADANISGIKSAYVKYQYTLIAHNGRGFPDSSEMWIVPRGEYYYLIVSGQRQDASAEDLIDIKRMIASIKVAQ